MKRARRRSFVPSLCVLLLAWTAAEAGEVPGPEGPGRVLHLGSDVWPPFTDLPGRRRVAVDLVLMALTRAGIEASTAIEGDFDRLLGELRAGELDGSVALWRTPEREKFLLFSSPYLENRLVLLARKGSDTSATSLARLAGKRVALVEGYAYGEAIETTKGPVFVRGRSDQENLERLLTGDVDYLVADEVLIHALFERYGSRARVLLDVGSAPIVERPLHFAVRRDLPDAAAIIARFDQAIRGMIADGSYNRILGMTWIRADVDGDGKSELVLGGQQAGVAAPEESYDVFGSRTGSAEADDDPGYVVDGKIYPHWSDIPSIYRVPIERKGAGPEPGITLFQF